MRDKSMTSSKKPNSIRHGGPGASHENAKRPVRQKQQLAQSEQKSRSKISGGGGERDSHHTHDPEKKGGQTPRKS